MITYQNWEAHYTALVILSKSPCEKFLNFHGTTTKNLNLSKMSYKIIKVLFGHHRGFQDNYRDDQNKKNAKNADFAALFAKKSDPSGARTLDLLIKSQ